MQDNNYLRFIEVLRAIASLTKTDLSPYIMKRYDQELQSYGYGKVADVLEQSMNDLKANSRLPSINEIKEMLGDVQLSDDELARDAIARIRYCIERYGYTRWDEAAEYIGTLGQHVVQMMGGWNEVCAFPTYKELDFALAQSREYAKVAVRKSRAEALESKPELPRGIPQSKYTELIADISKNTNLMKK